MTDTPALVRRLREFADELSKYQDTYASEEGLIREAADALSLGVARPDWEHAESSRVNAVWIEVLEAIGQAWETPQPYGESPTELITRLIDERDDARADLAAAIRARTALEQERDAYIAQLREAIQQEMQHHEKCKPDEYLLDGGARTAEIIGFHRALHWVLASLQPEPEA